MEEHQKHIAELREVSGQVKIKSKLVCFLYVLMRNEITPGKIATLIQEQKCENDTEVVYTNGWLARYAEYLADKLT